MWKSRPLSGSRAFDQTQVFLFSSHADTNTIPGIYTGPKRQAQTVLCQTVLCHPLKARITTVYKFTNAP
jgi:hypothetical protein